MTIVGGFDVHRSQITFDILDTETGEVRTGRIAPATRSQLRRWLDQFDGQKASFAVEGCTGWRFVVEELEYASVDAHLAEPADTATLRGSKKRAKTDKADARHLRRLLVDDRIPESWIPPYQVREVRTLARLYVALINQRHEWQQRMQAQVFHQGVPVLRCLLTDDHRRQLAEVDLSPSGREVIETGLRVCDGLTGEIEPLRSRLHDFASRQNGCRALQRLYGVGSLTAPIIWAEMGDTRRFHSSDHAVRHTGLDVTVYSSDDKRSSGHLARQGPPTLRWALYEAAYAAARKSSPDHAYYARVADRLGPNRAALSVARKLARRVHHILRELGDEAWEAVA